MKKLFKIAFTLLVGLQINNINAQDIKNQSELIREKLRNGRVKSVTGGSDINFQEILPEKNQPEHFQLITQIDPDHATESTRNKITEFFPDDIAFPVTYMKSSYEGNQKLQKKIGYSIRRGKPYGKERLVIVNNYLFYLGYWKNKNSYDIYEIYKFDNDTQTKQTNKKRKKKKRGFGSFFKKLKKGIKEISSSRVDKEKLKKEILQPYLDKGFSKQKSYYTKWIKKSKNKATKQYLDDLRAMMNKGVNQYNDSITKSPEWQRMLAFHKRMEGNSITVYNKSGRDVWVGHEKNAFQSYKVSNGMSTQVQHCNEPLYYYKSGSRGASGIKIANGGSKCGKTVTIN